MWHMGNNKTTENSYKEVCKADQRQNSTTGKPVSDRHLNDYTDTFIRPLFFDCIVFSNEKYTLKFINKKVYTVKEECFAIDIAV